MASSTQQRRHHTETESGYASFLIGAGLLFMMLAFGLSAIFGGTAEFSERFNLFYLAARWRLWRSA